MPELESTTLNDNAAESSTDSGTGDLIQTAEFEPAQPEESPKEALNPDEKDGGEVEAKEAEAPKEDAKAKDEPKKELSGDDARFDKHPRWKEMKRKADRVEALEGEIAQLKDAITKSQQRQTPPAYKDIFGMKDDDLRDQFDENPKEFLRNFGLQIQQSVMSAVSKHTEAQRTEAQQAEFDRGLRRTFDSFGEQHEDFWEMWDDGRGPIKEYMDKNPGHNAISAYMILTNEQREKEVQSRIDEAVKDAVKKAEESWIKNQKAKRHASVLSSGPSGVPPADENSLLHDTKRHGGFTSLMADKIRSMRSGAA